MLKKIVTLALALAFVAGTAFAGGRPPHPEVTIPPVVTPVPPPPVHHPTGYIPPPKVPPIAFDVSASKHGCAVGFSVPIHLGF
jgi:hypothetical protein